MSEKTSRDSINAALKTAATNHELRRRSKREQLLPLKEGITALREKKASFQIIAELLTQQGVPVGEYTVRAFCHAEIDGDRKEHTARRTRHDSKKRARPTGDEAGDPGRERENGERPQNFTSTLAGRKKSTPDEAQSSSAARKRGPRIANPSTL